MKRALENLQPFLVSWSGWLCVYYYIQCLAKRKKYTIIPMADPIWQTALFPSVFHIPKGYVAVLLGEPGKRVGIDIECYSERVRKVAHKFMREDEKKSLFKGTETWSLLLHWSAKETMFKCMNASDVDFREHLHVMPFTPDEQGVFSAAEYRTAEKQIFQIYYYLFSDFVLTLSL